jgi:hypothetical protein
MSFAAPLFLLAVLAGAIPVLLHLIHNRKAVKVPFSTLQFLRLSVQRTNRRRRIEDLVLLLARIAILVLIALGLAGPAITTWNAFLGQGAKSAVVIILDNSASMGVIDRGQVHFEGARRTAEQLLDRLHDGDAVAILPTGGPPGPEHGKLYHRHETVRQALAQCQVSHERADLAARLQQARQLLADSDAPHREIYILTDNQALSWQGLSRRGQETRAERETDDTDPADEPAVVVVNFNHDPAPNVALQKLQLEAPALTVGVPILARVEVRNTSSVVQQKHLELYLNGSKKAVSPTLSLEPAAAITYAFPFTLERGGVHRGEVRLAEEDGCALDNHLYFGLVVDAQIQVAIVKPQGQEIPYLEDTYYLEQALVPEDAAGWAIRARVLTPEQLATEPLSRYAVIFCVNLPAVPEGTAERLHHYLWTGGHVFWICGPNVQPKDYNWINDKVNGELLPAPLEDLRQRPTGRADSWHIARLDKDYPPLAPLTEPASLYRSVLVHKHFPLEWTKKSPGRVLARLDDGKPLLVQRPVGDGSVLLLGTAVHTEWTNLPVKQLFLPLFARLTFHLAGAARDRSQVLAGAPLAVPLPDRDKRVNVEIVRPSGAVVRTRSKGGKAAAFRYLDTHDVGVYQLRLHETQGHRTFVFAVNIDPDESDPACLSAEELKSRFGNRPVEVCAEPEELAATMERLREGISLRTWLLSAVLVALVLEAFFANHLGGKMTAPDNGRGLGAKQ